MIGDRPCFRCAFRWPERGDARRPGRCLLVVLKARESGEWVHKGSTKQSPREEVTSSELRFECCRCCCCLERSKERLSGSQYRWVLRVPMVECGESPGVN